jgi:hypothetical protein
LILSAGRPEAKAGDDSEGIDGHQHVKAFVPPPPGAPADIDEAGQPTEATALGLPRGCWGAVQSLKRTRLRLEPLDPIAKAGDQGVGVLADPAVELGAVRQGRKGAPPVTQGIAVERPPLSKHCHWPIRASVRTSLRLNEAASPGRRSGGAERPCKNHPP